MLCFRMYVSNEFTRAAFLLVPRVHPNRMEVTRCRNSINNMAAWHPRAHGIQMGLAWH